ncbi:hypothetical protein BVIET440_50315 [Burkholderia vietnamiensis]|nr:hypothetical protein BVI1335_1230046 [Burkholderia vietnamiensis]CAG9227464.1 hypothetical protein BVI434_500002 [Burkholderia vietnamiensis]
MLFVDSSHQQPIDLADRLRSVIHARSRNANQPRLSRNRQRMRTVDHRFALSSPALPSAPDKKSFSSVNWPIFACSVFTSTGDSFDAGPAAPNTSAARSCNCRFHSVIWFGCTSNCCASSASVCSPLTAASASFALNAAAECVRPVLFVISSVPLPALSLALAPAKPLIRLSEFARPPLVCEVMNWPARDKCGAQSLDEHFSVNYIGRRIAQFG